VAQVGSSFYSALPSPFALRPSPAADHLQFDHCQNAEDRKAF
jgi:hypothetical protein